MDLDPYRTYCARFGAAYHQTIISNWNDDRFKNPRFFKRGSYSSVYLCWDNQTGSDNAIVKYIPLPKPLTTELRQRIHREMLARQTLEHPNVIRTIDYRWGDEQLLPNFKFAMPRIGVSPSTDLARHLTNCGRLSSIDTKNYMYQILQGLSHCHSRSIVHCDLRLDNLLLDISPQTILITGFSHSIKHDDPPSPINQGSSPFITQDLLSHGMHLEPYLIELFAELRPDALDLLVKMLKIEPTERMSAVAALQHIYFDGFEPKL
ncbi:aurora/IPL1-related protein kinase 2-like [Salvia hispanica]|uniref:aurora/IPL1-related protein kinase 2-like n=1 Tax=Salvia hispanica TaxID=49212 RepID=UPI0020094A05|nr:aurora/IPL1-related protein kinase 2-like [Salvia hispanica]